MNEYEELWYETEGKNIENLWLKYSLKFYKYTLSHGGLKITNKFFKKMGVDVPYKLLGDFSLFSNEIKKWLRDNLLKEINKEKIINLFISAINSSITENNKELRVLYISSFKEMNIIKSIKLEKDGLLIITLKNNEQIKVLRILKSSEEVRKYRNNCHQLCYEYFKLKNDKNANIVSVFECDLYNRKQYHSFIVKDNIVYDYARNIAMSFSSYQKLFKPEIIMNINGMDLLKSIEELENKDKDFNSLDKWQPVLKYALYNVNKSNIIKK